MRGYIPPTRTIEDGSQRGDIISSAPPHLPATDHHHHHQRFTTKTVTAATTHSSLIGPKHFQTTSTSTAVPPPHSNPHTRKSREWRRHRAHRGRPPPNICPKHWRPSTPSLLSTTAHHHQRRRRRQRCRSPACPTAVPTLQSPQTQAARAGGGTIPVLRADTDERDRRLASPPDVCPKHRRHLLLLSPIPSLHDGPTNPTRLQRRRRGRRQRTASFLPTASTTARRFPITMGR
ncbi:hypothetical protein R3P38DRAFT_1193061 [Favolaschia claudopus]|uniref:Uncharacterized protein n=1 Tax=Favolaschia claudopus TaxID=2862362 RepID=A0AAW0E1S0_9AGAR